MVKETKGNVKFEDLDIRAKLNCMEQFINIIVPYADYDEGCLDDVGLSNLECVIIDIGEWIGEQFWFDENGDWYDEGRKVK